MIHSFFQCSQVCKNVLHMKTQKDGRNLVWIVKMQFYNKFLTDALKYHQLLQKESRWRKSAVMGTSERRLQNCKRCCPTSYLKMSKDGLFLVGQLFGKFYDPRQQSRAKKMLFNESILPVITHARGMGAQKSPLQRLLQRPNVKQIE